MVKDLYKYFVPEQQFYLNSVEYKIFENCEQLEEYNLNCTDNIRVDLKENIGVRVLFTRTLYFEPENLFKLSVSFGSTLNFEKDNKDEVDWINLNLAEEFKNNGEFVLNNLISRTSLLISQITSSFGQVPIITPPNTTGNETT